MISIPSDIVEQMEKKVGDKFIIERIWQENKCVGVSIMFYNNSK